MLFKIEMEDNYAFLFEIIKHTNLIFGNNLKLTIRIKSDLKDSF